MVKKLVSFEYHEYHLNATNLGCNSQSQLRSQVLSLPKEFRGTWLSPSKEVTVLIRDLVSKTLIKKKHPLTPGCCNASQSNWKCFDFCQRWPFLCVMISERTVGGLLPSVGETEEQVQSLWASRVWLNAPLFKQWGLSWPLNQTEPLNKHESHCD